MELSEQSQEPDTKTVTVSPSQEQFEIELEFVQCLASPSYLHFLAQNEYLDSPEFLEYLEYLQYWREPEYVRFIVFPHALYFLQLLREEKFREALKRSDYTLMLHQQQGFYWQFARTMRPMKKNPKAQELDAAAAAQKDQGSVGRDAIMSSDPASGTGVVAT